MKLTKKQTQALDLLEDKVTKEVLFGGGAGGGKSVIGVYWVIKSCVKYPKTRWLIGRAVLKTLKETTLKTFFEVAAMQGLQANIHYRYNINDSVITFWNGSEILLKDLYAYPRDPNFDELGSLECTGAFIDEANQVTEKAISIVKSRIRYKLEDYNLIPKIALSCNPAKNWVYTRFYKPDRDGTMPEGRAFVHSLVTDNPNISPHYIENLKELPEAQRQRLLFGNWDYDNDPSRLIGFDEIVSLWEERESKDAGKYISADIARLGKDSTTIFYWEGWTVKDIWVMPKNTVTEAAAKINELANAKGVLRKDIVIDEDGVGGGVVDILKGSVGFVNNSRALKGENYANLKAQCAYGLAAKINRGEMSIVPTQYREEIIKELEQIKSYNMDKDTKLQILPKDKVKEQIGKSPDFSDGLLMRYWFEVGRGRGLYGVV